MKTLHDFKAELLTRDGVRHAYEEQAPGFAIARAIIAARTRKRLTQAELAARMRTSQSYIARLENGGVLPTMKTLLRIAEATGTRAHLTFEEE